MWEVLVFFVFLYLADRCDKLEEKNKELMNEKANGIWNRQEPW